MLWQSPACERLRLWRKPSRRFCRSPIRGKLRAMKSSGVSSRLEPEAEWRDLFKIDSSTEFTLSAAEWARNDTLGFIRVPKFNWYYTINCRLF